MSLPPYSPQLDLAERVFEEIKGRVEGEVYESIQAKQREVDEYLEELAADPQRVRSLCGWCWIREQLQYLPTQ